MTIRTRSESRLNFADLTMSRALGRRLVRFLEELFEQSETHDDEHNTVEFRVSEQQALVRAIRGRLVANPQIAALESAAPGRVAVPVSLMRRLAEYAERMTDERRAQGTMEELVAFRREATAVLERHAVSRALQSALGRKPGRRTPARPTPAAAPPVLTLSARLRAAATPAACTCEAAAAPAVEASR
jgi:hypothetical protein